MTDRNSVSTNAEKYHEATYRIRLQLSEEPQYNSSLLRILFERDEKAMSVFNEVFSLE
jgi:hypothetical protein